MALRFFLLMLLKRRLHSPNFKLYKQIHNWKVKVNILCFVKEKHYQKRRNKIISPLTSRISRLVNPWPLLVVFQVSSIYFHKTGWSMYLKVKWLSFRTNSCCYWQPKQPCKKKVPWKERKTLIFPPQSWREKGTHSM